MDRVSTAHDVPAHSSPALLTAGDIDAAAVRIGSVVAATPLERCDRLSEITGANIWLKREDLQRVRSYKLRGAYNLMVQLTDKERGAGVVCASAGNHAQGVALACKALGIKGRIYLPSNTPKQKRDRIRAHGNSFVELKITGPTYDEAAAAAAEDCQQTGATLIPPFDDPRTAAGQGTIAAEILEVLDGQLDAIVVPVGGGGLIAGVTTYLRERSPRTTIVGAEPAGAASMIAALAAHGPVTLRDIDPFVDGAAVRRVGDFTYGVLAAAGATALTHASLPLVASVPRPSRPGDLSLIKVDEGAVCTAMLDLYQNEGIIAEPAGALATAALEQMTFEPGQNIVCIVSGGNNDVSRYGEILERSLVHMGLKHYFLVNFPQEPGALRRFLDQVLGPDDDITMFEYVKRNNRETGGALVGIELGDREGLAPLLARIRKSGMDVERLEPGKPAFRYLI
ncbi:threonine ammonia-lyase IlvA [Hoyosella sp. G463]|uniref:L-threonine dehydratase biosynthetic IlvA n=1 Tax=Lolliginicoccus lacisalsi TaxID=2742202 RepID=A0A927JEU9_9ACTN|nr:threonine ammonia-lyase IlvA [Lolliginicoccus lacisalsi]MBD8507781.1 threonine ammonia-lyase IlvA [Lolliginicoccus lacisalsi]